MGSANEELLREESVALGTGQTPGSARGPNEDDQKREAPGDDGIFVADVEPGVRREVTRGRGHLDALRASERRFRALTAVAFDGISVCDHDVVVDVNDQLAKMLGYERQELLGKDNSSLVAPESRALVAEATRSRREAPYRHVALRKDGSRLEVEVQARCTEWEGRTVQVTAMRDLSERLALEERVASVQRLEALGRLAGGIAHDFNNILVAIFSYADLADLDADSPALVRSHMEGMRAAAQRARDLAQQILTFGSQRGEQRVRMSVQPIVHEALRFLRSTLPRSIELRAEVSADAPEVSGAPVQIHQVVMNLCVNAVQAMNERGSLYVALARTLGSREMSQATPTIVEGRVYSRLTVQDTGKGMDAATVARIFEPFFTTKPGGEGSGLGLSVVHGVVQAHDGAIVVQSEPGGGARFDVYLPAAASRSTLPPGSAT